MVQRQAIFICIKGLLYFYGDNSFTTWYTDFNLESKEQIMIMLIRGAAMNKNTRRKTLLQMEVGLGKKIVLSALIMFFLIFFVYFFRIPNPNMIMLTGLVLCCAMFGYRGGITAAVIMLFYTLFFFSEDHSFIRFTNVNLQKVMVSLMGITMDVILVCSLKRAELKAFEEIDILTEELKKENELLSRASTTDPLTGIRNRLALSQDIERYLHHEVIVMMLDIDSLPCLSHSPSRLPGPCRVEGLSLFHSPASSLMLQVDIPDILSPA